MRATRELHSIDYYNIDVAYDNIMNNLGRFPTKIEPHIS